jgi:hypothetical protein
MTRLHLALETDNGIFREVGPVCGNDFRRTKRLTDDPDAVTCPSCRKLAGFDEGLTEVHGDPLLRAA